MVTCKTMESKFGFFTIYINTFIVFNIKFSKDMVPAIIPLRRRPRLLWCLSRRSLSLLPSGDSNGGLTCVPTMHRAESTSCDRRNRKCGERRAWRMNTHAYEQGVSRSTVCFSDARREGHSGGMNGVGFQVLVPVYILNITTVQGTLP